MTQNTQILLNRIAFSCGLLKDDTAKHEAYKFLLPAEHTGGQENSFLDKLASKFRPPERPWALGMTSTDEQAYFQWYARSLYKGNGKIVELGSWLGSLTKSILAGLQENKYLQNPDTSELYHVYDIFEWHHSFEEAVAGTPLANTMKDGDDYMHHFSAHVGDISNRATAYKADLCSEQWTGAPIEFLLVDAMKYEALIRNIQSSFFPALMPGKSFLAHQDFMHFYEGWIHISMFKMRNYFKPVVEISNGGTFVFKCLKQPDADSLSFPESVSEIPADMITETYKWVDSIISPAQRHKMVAANIMMHFHRNDLESAARMFKDNYINGPFQESSEFKMMDTYLKDDRGVDLATI